MCVADGRVDEAVITAFVDCQMQDIPSIHPRVCVGIAIVDRQWILERGLSGLSARREARAFIEFGLGSPKG